MKHFVSTEPCIWDDPGFRPLSDRGKLVYLAILTHPHVQPFGGLRTTLQGLAAELRWTLGKFRKACQELQQAGLLHISDTLPLFWLPRFLHHKPPATPEDSALVAQFLRRAPQCELKNQIAVQTDRILKSLGEELYAPFRTSYWIDGTPPDHTELPTPQPAATTAVTPQPPVPVRSTVPAPISGPAFLSAAELDALHDRFFSPQPDSPSHHPHKMSAPLAPPQAIRQEVSADQITIPKSLRTQPFRQAWTRWLAHLDENNWQPKRIELETQLKLLTHRGPRVAVGDIDYSIANGHRTIQRQQRTAAVLT